MKRSDVEPFIGVFSSLAAIGGLNVEVWNQTSPVFSSVSKPQEIPVSKEAREFSDCIRRRATFQQAVIGNNRQVFGTPIGNGQDPIGALIAYRAAPDSGPVRAMSHACQEVGVDDIEPLLGSMAELIEQHCGTQKEIESLASELAKSFEDIYVYSTVAGQIKRLNFPSRKQTDLAEDIMEAMHMDLAFIVMPQRKNNNVIVHRKDIAANRRELEQFVNKLETALTVDPSQEAQDYFMINDSGQNPVFSRLNSKAYRFLAVRIQHEGNLYGWLGLVSFNTDEIFRRSELRLLLSMAEQLALVIFGSDLYYDLERLLINVVKSLVHTIEAKDVYTRGHSERVSHRCLQLADHIGLNDKEKKVLQLAALLHDIGKIGTPENILNKPGSLDNEEISLIREHPQNGYNILKPLEELSESLPGILYHHERYDGRGYPAGLKGDEIPFQARLIAVADVYDAFTTERAYRAAISPANALAIMEKEAGKQLDPHCVAVFKEVINLELNGKTNA